MPNNFSGIFNQQQTILSIQSAQQVHVHVDLWRNVVKQVRTNIGLADTLIPSSVIYLIFMGRTGPCDLIIFFYHVNSQYIILNIKFGVNRMFHVVKTQYTDLTYMGGTGPCGPMTIIFGGSVI